MAEYRDKIVAFAGHSTGNWHNLSCTQAQSLSIVANMWSFTSSFTPVRNIDAGAAGSDQYMRRLFATLVSDLFKTSNY